MDLIPQLHILEKLDEFGGYKRFVDTYCAGPNYASNLKQLNYMLHKTCFYRRKKADVLKDLPAKMRSIVKCDIGTQREYDKAENDLATFCQAHTYFLSYLRQHDCGVMPDMKRLFR